MIYANVIRDKHQKAVGLKFHGGKSDVLSNKFHEEMKCEIETFKEKLAEIEELSQPLPKKVQEKILEGENSKTEKLFEYFSYYFLSTNKFIPISENFFYKK